MKKNWVSIVSLVLNVVLLVSVISLGGKLERTEENLRGWIGHVEHEVQESTETVVGRVERLLEDSAKQVADFSVEPVGVDAENRTLEVNLRLNLSRWSEDTTVVMEVAAGANLFLTALPVDGAGSCNEILSFPMDNSMEIRLTAAITTGGVTTREELGSWSDVSMLLPVQLRSWGGTSPVYRDGCLTIEQQEGWPETPDGDEARVSDICYRLYVNHEKVREASQCENWQQECAAGDEIRLTLFCRDEYGLGYEFTLLEFVCDETAGEAGIGSSSKQSISPVLSWD